MFLFIFFNDARRVHVQPQMFDVVLQQIETRKRIACISMLIIMLYFGKTFLDRSKLSSAKASDFGEFKGLDEVVVFTVNLGQVSIGAFR